MKVSGQTKFRLGGERFDIKMIWDGRIPGRRFILKIPKTFTVFDVEGQKVSHITKKPFSLLPQFTVELADGSIFFSSVKN